MNFVKNLRRITVGTTGGLLESIYARFCEGFVKIVPEGIRGRLFEKTLQEFVKEFL